MYNNKKINEILNKNNINNNVNIINKIEIYIYYMNFYSERDSWFDHNGQNSIDTNNSRPNHGPNIRRYKKINGNDINLFTNMFKQLTYDKINILIEIDGYARNGDHSNNLKILYMRPCPIQIGYMGFFGIFNFMNFMNIFFFF